MDTKITPDLYCDIGVFQKEQAKIFHQMWIWIGLKRDLRNHNDFITRDIGGRSVIVQNINGKLCAFSNICTHRFSRIHVPAKGNRQLRCNYHGWQFDSDGLPSAIPKRPRFDDLTQEKICNLRLTRWNVDVCGELVFVSTFSQKGDLRSYLGSLFVELETISNSCGFLIDENVMQINANWKILVENTLESYHVGFVHPETFGKLAAGDGEFKWNGRHSTWVTSVGKASGERTDRLTRILDGRPIKLPGYQHYFVFPNLTVATTYGTSFSIQLFDPISPNSTRFTSLVFATKLIDDNPTSREALRILAESVKNFNRAVFQEDKDICEQVHLGSSESQSYGILSDEEMRVAHFQEKYTQVMDSSI